MEKVFLVLCGKLDKIRSKGVRYHNCVFSGVAKRWINA